MEYIIPRWFLFLMLGLYIVLLTTSVYFRYEVYTLEKQNQELEINSLKKIKTLYWCYEQLFPLPKKFKEKSI